MSGLQPLSKLTRTAPPVQSCVCLWVRSPDRQPTWLVPGWTSVRPFAKLRQMSLVSPSKKLCGKRVRRRGRERVEKREPARCVGAARDDDCQLVGAQACRRRRPRRRWFDRLINCHSLANSPPETIGATLRKAVPQGVGARVAPDAGIVGVLRAAIEPSAFVWWCPVHYRRLIEAAAATAAHRQRQQQALQSDACLRKTHSAPKQPASAHRLAGPHGDVGALGQADGPDKTRRYSVNGT